MSAANQDQIVVFELDGQYYALPILEIQEIIRTVDVTPVPNTNNYVEGVINLRGNVIPIINLRKRLGLSKTEKNDETRIVVVEHNEEKIGLVVDKVLEVGQYRKDEIEPPSVIGQNVEFLHGVVKKKNNLWLLLNLAKVV